MPKPTLGMLHAMVARLDIEAVGEEQPGLRYCELDLFRCRRAGYLDARNEVTVEACHAFFRDFAQVIHGRAAAHG